MIIKLNGTDITDEISVRKFQKTDHYKSRSDRLVLLLEKAGNTGTIPKGDDEVEVIHDSNTIFLGSVVRVNRQLSQKNYVEIKVDAKSPEHEMNRYDVTEKFTSTTVNDIIKNNLVPDYAASYTTNKVDCSIEVDTVSFNHLNLTDCLDKLAKMTNFTWYVDYDKDIHFFAKSEETTPFDITDAGLNHIVGSLEVNEDFTQIKNIIKVRGGLAESNQDTKSHTGDGTTKVFDTEYRFSELPTVTVNGVGQNVGVAYLNEIDDYDCVWSYQEKFVKFKNAVPDGDAIEITALPEYPILISTNSPSSIETYGEWEFYLKDKNIASRGEAYERALAELEASASRIKEARFQTYKDGLRSGQLMTISLPVLDVDEEFIIQQVTTKIVRPNDDTGEAKLVYTVELSTRHRIGIVEFLQDQLFEEELKEDNAESLLSFRSISDTMAMTDNVAAPITTSPPYQVGSTRVGFGTVS